MSGGCSKFELARLAEQTERYEDMREAMREHAEQKKLLNVEERNLLSVAYKNVVGTRRSSWRVVSSIVSKDASETQKKIATEYLNRINNELRSICNEVLKLLEECLIPEATSTEDKVFYLKMQGDYHRYCAEVAVDDRDDTVLKSLEAYRKATDIAKADMSPVHPIRLGLALNFSVFHYEISNNADQARLLAKSAFDDAISNMEDLERDKFKDSTLIMQLLRDNLTLWTSEGHGDEDGDGE